MKRDVFPVVDYQHGPADIMAVGNFGVMYRAFWRARGIHVALKHVPRKSEGGRKVEAEERGAMLQQEFGSSHRGVVPEIYEHGRSVEGDYYIAMELLDGRALSTLLGEERLSHARAAEIALWIAADFLANLHAFGGGGDQADMVVYSDLKPDHIFVLADGSLRALDFGITKRVQQANTSTVNPWASVPYASPRRLREGVVDRDADFWALGVILYEMVAGHHLYPGVSAEAMSRAIERQDPPAPLPPCDPRLAAIIGKLLAPQRHESYQQASEIAADLRTLIDGGQPGASSARLSASVPTARVPISRDRGAVSGPSVPTDPVPAGARAAAPVLPAPMPVAAPPIRQRWRRSKRVRAIVAAAVILLVLSQASAWRREEAFRERIDTIEATSLTEVRASLRQLGSLPDRVSRPLADRLLVLAERPILDYRTDLPAVAKPQWLQARECLTLAAEVAPGDSRVAARAAYVDAHLARIAAADQTGTDERQTLDEAVRLFKEAARLDPRSPDPYLGLARIHAYDFKDFDALMADLRDAQERGYRQGRRERSQVGDAYRFRADRARLDAREADGDERMRLLRAVADDYEMCAERFEGLGNFLDSARNFRLCQQQHSRLRLEIAREEFDIKGFLSQWGRFR
jgi:serine/threonine-protein kinase